QVIPSGNVYHFVHQHSLKLGVTEFFRHAFGQQYDWPPYPPDSRLKHLRQDAQLDFAVNAKTHPDARKHLGFSHSSQLRSSANRPSKSPKARTPNRDQDKKDKEPQNCERAEQFVVLARHFRACTHRFVELKDWGCKLIDNLNAISALGV